MPIPKPSNGEKEQEYISRCVRFVKGEKPDLDNDQAVAMCYTGWKEKDKMENQNIAQSIEEQVPEKKKSKIELLNDIRKLLEKNGVGISDNKLLELFSSFSETTLCHTFKLEKHQGNLFRVFPRKKAYIAGYDKEMEFDELFFDELINNFKNKKLFQPFIDEQHNDGRKFGTIINLIKKPDGLYAEAEWNEEGKKVIKGNIYSYISPKWGKRIDLDGNEYNKVLWAVTLTNIPALEGENATLQEQIKLEKKLGGKPMLFDRNESLDKKVIKLEALIKNGVQLQNEPGGGNEMLMEVYNMLKEALMKIEEMTGEKKNAEEIAEKAVSELTKIRAEKQLKEKEDFFKMVVEKGKVEMTELESWKEHYDKSPEFVQKILTAKPDKTDMQLSSALMNEKDDGLTKDDYLIAKSCGYDLSKKEDRERYILSQK